MADLGALYDIADELRGLANLGRHFATDPYDRERYERLLALSARLAAALAGQPAQPLAEAFADNLLHVSPLAGADALVERDGALLLIQRRDNGLWALPGGLVEVGETLAEAACRELWEEAGLRGRPLALLGVFDSRLWGSRTRAQLYHVIFRVAVAAGAEPQPGPEALAAAFYSPTALPPLAPGHHRYVPVLARLLRGELPAPYFDAPEP